MDTYYIYFFSINIVNKWNYSMDILPCLFHLMKLKLNLLINQEKENLEFANFLKYCDSIIQDYNNELIEKFNDSIITNVSYSIGFTENLGVSGTMLVL